MGLREEWLLRLVVERAVEGGLQHQYHQPQLHMYASALAQQQGGLPRQLQRFVEPWRAAYARKRQTFTTWPGGRPKPLPASMAAVRAALQRMRLQVAAWGDDSRWPIGCDLTVSLDQGRCVAVFVHGEQAVSRPSPSTQGAALPLGLALLPARLLQSAPGVAGVMVLTVRDWEQQRGDAARQQAYLQAALQRAVQQPMQFPPPPPPLPPRPTASAAAGPATSSSSATARLEAAAAKLRALG
jgi:hypothetical protein